MVRPPAAQHGPGRAISDIGEREEAMKPESTRCWLCGEPIPSREHPDSLLHTGIPVHTKCLELDAEDGLDEPSHDVGGEAA